MSGPSRNPKRQRKCFFLPASFRSGRAALNENEGMLHSNTKMGAWFAGSRMLPDGEHYL